MGEYKIGRDFQELRSRIECLEAHIGEDRTISNRRGAGACHAASGVTADKPPVIWKPEKYEHVPPFIHSLLGVPLLEGPFDFILQSKTWDCTPEPNILNVRWFAGGPDDEFYRLENQKFTILTSGQTASAFYLATLRASGKATNVIPGIAGIGNNLVFELELTYNPALGGGQGFGLFYYVKCKDNYLFACGGQIDPDDFDRVSGATWGSVAGVRVNGC